MQNNKKMRHRAVLVDRPFLFLLALVICAGTWHRSFAAFGTGSLIDTAAYSSWHVGENPLGLLQDFTHRLSITTGYAHMHSSNVSYDDSVFAFNSLEAIDMRAGTPGHMLARVQYRFVPGSFPYESDLHEFLLHEVGVHFAGNTAQGLLRIGGNLVGRFGGGRFERYQRLHLELYRVRLFLGTTLLDMVRIDAGTGVSGLLDTLKDTESHNPQVDEDNIGEVSLPLLFFTLDLNRDDFPVAANGALVVGKNHSVYSVNEIHRDALVADTLHWELRGRYTVPPLYTAGEDIRLMPALGISHTRSHVTRYDATEDNYPLQYGDKQQDSGWISSHVQVGGGIRAGYGADLSCGFGYDFVAAGYNASDTSADAGLHGFDINVQGAPLHLAGRDYAPGISDMTFGLHYQFMQRNDAIGSLGAGWFGSVHPAAVRSQLPQRYEPVVRFHTQWDLHRTGLEARALLFDSRLAIEMGIFWLFRHYTDGVFSGNEQGLAFRSFLTYRIP